MSDARTRALNVQLFEALAPTTPIVLDDVVAREYGHYLEDFVPQTVFVHPRGRTLDAGFMLDYATTFMEANPLYLNEEWARANGYVALPAAPHLVLNVALSLGVQNDSEKAIANLGYYDVRFLRAVSAGDTLAARSRVVDRRDRGVGKPGIVTVQTLATNQHGDVVIQYRRKIMVPRRGADELAGGATQSEQPMFPWVDEPDVHIPLADDAALARFAGITTDRTRLSAFAPGRIFVHGNGRTVTDEHVEWTYKVMNTHPLHYDRLYSTGRTGKMSGEPIVYGGLVFAWLVGLASRDTTENAVWDLGYHDGYHTQPTFAGDTIAALSRVLEVDEARGVVRVQLVGVKNVRAADALEQHGEALFVRERDKRGKGLEKLPDKIFEIERELLIRR